MPSAYLVPVARQESRSTFFAAWIAASLRSAASGGMRRVYCRGAIKSDTDHTTKVQRAGWRPVSDTLCG